VVPADEPLVEDGGTTKNRPSLRLIHCEGSSISMFEVVDEEVQDRGSTPLRSTTFLTTNEALPAKPEHRSHTTMEKWEDGKRLTYLTKQCPQTAPTPPSAARRGPTRKAWLPTIPSRRISTSRRSSLNSKPPPTVMKRYARKAVSESVKRSRWHLRLDASTTGVQGFSTSTHRERPSQTGKASMATV